METIKQLISRILNIDSSIIDDNSSPQNIESWDSFNGILLVSELEKNFDVHFTMEEVLNVKRYKDIKDALKRHHVIKGVDD